MILGLLLAAALASPQADAEQEGSDVVVTARKLATKPIRDAIGYFERHCFDAGRLTRRPSSPRADPDWHELSAAERAEFDLAGKPDRAFGVRRPDGQALVLTLSESKPAKDLLELRCTLIVVGGDQARFPDRVSAMFGGPGTRKHIDAPGGVPAKPGWRQLLWAAIPSTNSAKWQVFRTREATDTWVQVIDPVFFQSAEYVRADLRMRTVGTPLTVLTLIHTRRPSTRD